MVREKSQIEISSLHTDSIYEDAFPIIFVDVAPVCIAETISIGNERNRRISRILNLISVCRNFVECTQLLPPWKENATTLNMKLPFLHGKVNSITFYLRFNAARLSTLFILSLYYYITLRRKLSNSFMNSMMLGCVYADAK